MCYHGALSPAHMCTHTREMQGRGETRRVFFFLLTGERLHARRAGEMNLIRQLWSHQLNREKKDSISKTFINFFFFGIRVIPTTKPVIYSPLRRKYETASHQIRAVLINAFQCAGSSLPAVPYLLSWVHGGCSSSVARVALLRGGKKRLFTHSLISPSQMYFAVCMSTVRERHTSCTDVSH